MFCSFEVHGKKWLNQFPALGTFVLVENTVIVAWLFTSQNLSPTTFSYHLGAPSLGSQQAVLK